MHHRNGIWLSALCIVGLVLPAAADDKETIDKLQKENAELRKLLEREREVAKLNELRAKAAADESTKARDESLKVLKEAEAAAQKARKLEQEQAEAAKRFADENAKTAAQLQKVAEAAAKEAEARRDEAKRVLELAEKERAERVKVLDEAARMKEKAAQLELELQLYKRRALELEKRVVELEKARGGKDPVENRAPANVRGKILKAGESIVLLNIGADSGLATGHSLEVIRPAKDGKGAQYLGTVVIVRAEAKQAAAKFMGTNKTIRPEEGDEVFSGINR